MNVYPYFVIPIVSLLVITAIAICTLFLVIQTREDTDEATTSINESTIPNESIEATLETNLSENRYGNK